MHALIDNRIPPEWVDHAYPYGVITLNTHYGGTTFAASFLDAIDDERIARLARYGTPAAIPEWDGWFEPTRDEVQTVLGAIEAEMRANRELLGLRSPSWLLVGEDGIDARLRHRPSTSTIHTPVLPQYDELDANAATTAGAPGNTTVLATADETMANAVDESPAGQPATTGPGDDAMGGPEAADVAEDAPPSYAMAIDAEPPAPPSPSRP